MKTEELVAKLARDIRPVHPLSWRKKTTLWIALAVAYSALFVYLYGARFDLPSKLSQPSFVLPILVLVALALGSATVFSFLSIPRLRASTVQKWFPWLILGAWMAYLGASLLSSTTLGFHGLLHPVSWPCVRDLLIFGAGPFILAWKLVRSGAPTQQSMASLHALMASGAIASIGVQFICVNDSPAHLLVWHVFPFVIVVICLRKFVALTFRWV